MLKAENYFPKEHFYICINTSFRFVFSALFVETNPVPVKTAIEWHTGLPTTAVRLPLTPLEAGSVETLREVCARLGIGA